MTVKEMIERSKELEVKRKQSRTIDKVEDEIVVAQRSLDEHKSQITSLTKLIKELKNEIYRMDVK